MRKVKVLCQFETKHAGDFGVEILRDAFIIKVTRSSHILREFEYELHRRASRGYWTAKLDDTRLVSYLPENGQRRFYDEVDSCHQEPLH